MLRRFAFGFLGVAAAATVIAGCASGGATQTVSIGPSFAPQSLYATNSTQNGISIYTGTSGGPTYQISTGGSSNGLNGPQYLAFDANSNIITTNYSSSTHIGSIVVIKASATGNVLPFNQSSLGNGHPRGIADYQIPQPGSSPSVDGMVVGYVDPGQQAPFQSRLIIFTSANLLGAQLVGGPATGLNVPSGIAVDKNDKIYVTNLQGPSGVAPVSNTGSVEIFALPSPSPTPSPTATPSPSPSPTATPTGATPSPTPTAVPTATPVNIPPATTIAGAATGINQPTGIALDASGNIYVSDLASTICHPGSATTCPAILIFTAGAAGNATPKYIAGSATNLFAPTDVKVDSSGKIYVADSTAAGAGVIYVFAPGSTGNVAPANTFTSPGSVIGLGLAP